MSTMLDELMAMPDMYPLSMDVRKHLITFVRMSPESYRNSSFLDLRTVHASPETYIVNLDDLLLYSNHCSAPVAPVHYILHGAFCCSTLLTRHLDLIPHCFVLREPTLLTQLAMLRPTNDGASKNGTANWYELFLLGIRLLARRYAPKDNVFIKANDLCNGTGDVLLGHDDRSKVLFLASDLRTFLLSVLKSDQRRNWMRGRLRAMARCALRFPVFANIPIGELEDAEGTAYLWLLNKELSRHLRAQDSARVLEIDGAQIAEAPKETLLAVANFFAVPLSEGLLCGILDHPSLSRYSKNAAKAYDRQARRDELVKLNERFGKEADHGIEWTLAVDARLGLDVQCVGT